MANDMNTGDQKHAGAKIKNDDEAVEKAKGVCQKLLMQCQRAKLAVRQAIKTAGGQMKQVAQEKLVDKNAIDKIHGVIEFLEEQTLVEDKDNCYP